MNGPEHYAEAEQLLRDAADDIGDDLSPGHQIERAQVHATLALVAAQVGARRQDPSRQEFGHSDVDRAFYEVTQ